MSIGENALCVKQQSLALQGYCAPQLFGLLKDLRSVSHCKVLKNKRITPLGLTKYGPRIGIIDLDLWN